VGGGGGVGGWGAGVGRVYSAWFATQSVLVEPGGVQAMTKTVVYFAR